MFCNCTLTHPPPSLAFKKDSNTLSALSIRNVSFYLYLVLFVCTLNAVCVAYPPSIVCICWRWIGHVKCFLVKTIWSQWKGIFYPTCLWVQHWLMGFYKSSAWPHRPHVLVYCFYFCWKLSIPFLPDLLPVCFRLMLSGSMPWLVCCYITTASGFKQFDIWVYIGDIGK